MSVEAIDYHLQARFRVRFRLLGPGWIEGEAAGFTARGSTEDEVIERLAEEMRAAHWRPPTRKKAPVEASS